MTEEVERTESIPPTQSVRDEDSEPGDVDDLVQQPGATPVQETTAPAHQPGTQIIVNEGDFDAQNENDHPPEQRPAADEEQFLPGTPRLSLDDQLLAGKIEDDGQPVLDNKNRSDDEDDKQIVPFSLPKVRPIKGKVFGFVEQTQRCSLSPKKPSSKQALVSPKRLRTSVAVGADSMMPMQGQNITAGGSSSSSSGAAAFSAAQRAEKNNQQRKTESISHGLFDEEENHDDSRKGN
ncbi:unnamed protein product, partial [Amoebophrya sp. A120]|eukprot:GSA120T00011205001.1